MNHVQGVQAGGSPLALNMFDDTLYHNSFVTYTVMLVSIILFLVFMVWAWRRMRPVAREGMQCEKEEVRRWRHVNYQRVARKINNRRYKRCKRSISRSGYFSRSDTSNALRYNRKDRRIAGYFQGPALTYLML